MILWTGLLCSAAQSCTAAETDDLLEMARAALAKGETDQALLLADKAIALDGKRSAAYLLRGAIHDAQHKPKKALSDLNQVLELDSKAIEAYDLRGSVHFKLGNFRESLADFDQYLDSKPTQRAGHWRRGITCYYAGRFDEGRKQFEGYEKVDANDVENAVWHYLCLARAEGPDKARASILKIGKDARVPMMQVYALYAGKGKPEDVIAATEAGKPTPEQLHVRLFYAHLYLGLYYEVMKDKPRSLEHLTLAADKYRVTQYPGGLGYMGAVARVHMELLRK